MKMKLSDNSKKTKRLMVAASGAQGIVSSTDSNAQEGYVKSSTTLIPITRNAQYAGTGASTIWTQPMFFSPLHTPQNWQIPSKRRESYQWANVGKCKIITSDYTFKSFDEFLFICDEKIEDIVTGGVLYENIKSESILGAKGEFRNPSHYAVRDCIYKRCFSLSSYGYWRNLEVSEEHNVFVLDGKLYRHKRKLEKDDIYRKSLGICGKGDKPKIQFPKKLICKKEAQNVSKKDYLLTPLPKTGKIALESNLAWSIGLCVADGTIASTKHNYTVAFTHEKNESHQKELTTILTSSFSGKVGSRKHGDGNGWRTSVSTKESHTLFSKYITGKHRKKKFTVDVFELDKESRLHILGGYFDGDGSFNKKKKTLVANNYSCDMADQLYWMLLSCGINCSLIRHSVYGDHYKTDAKWIYWLHIPSSEVPKLAPYLRSNKIPKDFKPKKQRQLRFLYEEDGVSYLAQPISKIKEFVYTGKGYDIQVDPERAFVASGYITSNCRFYYSNEPKVAAGVDFYSNFGMNGFKLECKNKKILNYYEKLTEKLNLAEKLNEISHEYFLIGDVFPFLEIGCPECLGTGMLSNGAACNHPDGTFKAIKIMNPDYIEVKTNPLADEPEYYLVPDEELRQLIARREPRKIYDNLPQELINLVSSAQPIPLSNRCISHIKFNPSPYGTYGNSMLQRLFTILAYKTKIMTANWIIAERMIVPIRFVKVGDKDRPAIEDDLQNMSNQLAAVANDPNLTIVTHHAVDIEWVGANAKIFNITPEQEQIGKEILDGLMLNQALLNGEASSYSSAQVGVEVLIRRLENWRNKLKEWVEKHIFLPIAMMQGFFDPEKSKELGNKEFLYPKLIWNDLQLRDKTNKIQTMMQLYDKGLISAQTILEELELDYDVEVEKIRSEQALASATGMLGGGMGGDMGGGNLGTMGMGGGAPVGGAPMDLGGMGGMPGGEMGGAPMGGEMGGAPAGGMGGAPGGMASAENLPVITKRGKKREIEEQQTPPPKMIRFTKLEQQMYKLLQSLEVPTPLFGQFNVKVPGEKNAFVLDFAYPKIGVGVECLHPDTLISTTEGIKKADEIEEGNKLYGRDGKVVEVVRYIENQYDKDMYTIKANGMLPIRVTDNHPIHICKPKKTRVKRKETNITRTREYIIPGEIKKTRADCIEIGDYVVVPKRKTKSPIEQIELNKYQVKNNSNYKLPDNIKLDEDFGWLMGIYAAEGSCKEKPNASVQFSLNINEIEYSDKIQYLLEKIFNIKSSVHIDIKGNCRRVVSYCSSLAKFLSMNFNKYAPYKEVPSFMYDAPDKCKYSFVMGCIDGDGCKRKNGTYRLVSSSQKLLMGIQSLILSLGYWASISNSRKSGIIMKICDRKCMTNGLWELDTLLSKHKKISYREDENNFYVLVKKIDKDYYKGKVINYTVNGEGNSNHTYLAQNITIFNCDGEIWHEREDLQQRDQLRDQKLANIGWRVLRFKEAAMDEHLDAIKDIIYKNIIEAAKQHKKASENNETMEKYASLTEFININNTDTLKIRIEDLPNDIGELWLIGI